MRRRSDELSRSKSDAFRKYFKALYREIRIKKREGRIITIPDDPTQMTANLKAPILINIPERVARQCVLQDNNLAIREPIFMQLQQRVVQAPQAPIKKSATDFPFLLEGLV